jgi:hypothetical protein
MMNDGIARAALPARRLPVGHTGRKRRRLRRVTRTSRNHKFHHRGSVSVVMFKKSNGDSLKKRNNQGHPSYDAKSSLHFLS